MATGWRDMPHPPNERQDDSTSSALPLRNVTRGRLTAFVALGLFGYYVLPDLTFPNWFSDWAQLRCDGAVSEDQLGWCTTNEFDLTVAETLVLAPRMTGYLSHVFTFAACPGLALWSLSEVQPAHAWENRAAFVGTNLVSATLNIHAKRMFRRQRPCFHFGREASTQAADLAGWQQWVSFYSGDTAMAFSFVSTGVALTAARGRAIQARDLARVGGCLAAIGSVLRIVADMHWGTDVLVGCFMGCTVGGGLPTLLFRVAGADDRRTNKP